MLAELVAKGVKIQVNSGSLGGLYGAAVQAAAEALIREGLAHLLGSDGHDYPDREVSLAAGAERLRVLAGPEVALALTVTNPLSILTEG